VLVLGIAFARGAVGEAIWLGGFALGPWNLHPLVLMYVVSGSLMVSTFRIPSRDHASRRGLPCALTLAVVDGAARKYTFAMDAPRASAFVLVRLLLLLLWVTTACSKSQDDPGGSSPPKTATSTTIATPAARLPAASATPPSPAMPSGAAPAGTPVGLNELPPDIRAQVEKAQAMLIGATTVSDAIKAKGIAIDELSVAKSGDLVVLSGSAKNRADRDGAEAVAKKVPGVARVQNGIVVR